MKKLMSILVIFLILAVTGISGCTNSNNSGNNTSVSGNYSTTELKAQNVTVSELENDPDAYIGKMISVTFNSSFGLTPVGQASITSIKIQNTNILVEFNPSYEIKEISGANSVEFRVIGTFKKNQNSTNQNIKYVIEASPTNTYIISTS